MRVGGARSRNFCRAKRSDAEQASFDDDQDRNMRFLGQAQLLTCKRRCDDLRLEVFDDDSPMMNPAAKGRNIKVAVAQRTLGSKACGTMNPLVP